MLSLENTLTKYGNNFDMKNKQQMINFSLEHKKYLKKLKNEKIFVLTSQIMILVLFFALWELFASIKVIDPFFVSSPSRIMTSLISLFSTGEIWGHIGITFLETLLGFIIATLGGTLIAVLLWWSERLRKILDPYIVVLNSLPKIALGPILILWIGSGMKAIVAMCVLICIILTTINMLNAFITCDKNKINLMKSMHASKFQIFWKLVLPSSITQFIAVLKINVGMSWVGSIMGEYISSSKGLGYLIVYGGQMLKMDLVMTSILILCLLAGGMYFLVCLLEKKIQKTH